MDITQKINNTMYINIKINNTYIQYYLVNTEERSTNEQVLYQS